MFQQSNWPVQYSSQKFLNYIQWVLGRNKKKKDCKIRYQHNDSLLLCYSSCCATVKLYPTPTSALSHPVVWVHILSFPVGSVNFTWKMHNCDSEFKRFRLSHKSSAPMYFYSVLKSCRIKSYGLFCARGQASWPWNLLFLGFFLSGYIWDIMYGTEVRIVLIAAFLSFSKKNTLRCRESNPVQVQNTSRHVHQKSKTAKSP